MSISGELILVLMLSLVNLCACVGIVAVGIKDSVMKNVSSAQGAPVREGLGFLGCYTTAQNNHQNERVP